MENLLNTIGNKKLITAFESGNKTAFSQIATKLYNKARGAQDKKEYLLAECIKYSNDESVDIDSAFEKYLNIEIQETALISRANIQCTAEFINEKDVLKRYDMKISAYEEAHNARNN